MTRGRLLFLLLIVMALGTLVVQGQRFGRNRFGGFDRFSRNYYQNEPPDAEFVMARWHYGAGRGGGGWAHDYPTAEEHILQIMHEATGINTERLAYRVVELSSPEIFNFPFSYVSEPGEMELSEQEVVNLREYINRGGFVMIDDFGDYGHEAGGDWEFQSFRHQMLRVFPDREMFILTDEHSLLNIFYHIDSIQTVHPMTEIKSIFYGYPGPKGELAMIVCYANDVGDYWEFIDEPRYAVRPSAEALKLGINFVMYAMTH